MRISRRGVVTLLSCIAIVPMLIAATPVKTEMVKQNGGSTGDSVTAAADTSDAVLLPKAVTNLWFVVANDSSTAYTVQISADSTHWSTVDLDTVSAGWAETTTDFGSLYATYYVRVIQDMIPSGGADFGSAWVQVAK